MDKRAFVKLLAQYLAGDQVGMSMRLALDPGDPGARLWQRMRAESPLRGYPTAEEAEAQLAQWLGVP